MHRCESPRMDRTRTVTGSQQLFSRIYRIDQESTPDRNNCSHGSIRSAPDRPRIGHRCHRADGVVPLVQAVVLATQIALTNKAPFCNMVVMTSIPSWDLWPHWIKDDVIGIVGSDLVEAWYTVEHILGAVLGRVRRH
jgi:hypothetical protein